MTHEVLLYGATGHSGELIARMAARKRKGIRLVLAGRSPAKLKKLAEELGLPWRAFRLDDLAEVVRNLQGVRLLVNAAGPFALTAPRLVRAALEVGAHYVDINGEADVYMKLDDLARQANYRKVALVCSAGHTAGASCILLHLALQKLVADIARVPEVELKPLPDPDTKGEDKPHDLDSPTRIVRMLGDIRIALSMAPEVSKGSAASGLRLTREQVLIVRRGERVIRDGRRFPAMVKWHEPVGRLERIFNFGGLARDERRPRHHHGRVTSAASMTDTLVALQLLERGDGLTGGKVWLAGSIESYLQMDPPQRLAYQLGALFSPLLTAPGVAASAQVINDLALPDRPASPPSPYEEQVVVLEIDSVFRERLIEARLRTTSGYDYTTRLVVALMEKLAAPGSKPPPGWQTPVGIFQGSIPGDLRQIEWIEPKCQEPCP